MTKPGYTIDDQYSVYFLTLTTVGWVALEGRKIVIGSIKYCIDNKGLVINAYVLMESHLHLIARAQEGTSGLSDILRDFKKHTAKELINWVTKSGRESRKEWMTMVMKYHAKNNKNNSMYQLWQQNNRPKECIQPRFTWQKIDYIHMNPVNAMIVDKPEDYLHSSARNYLGHDNGLLKVELIETDYDIGYGET